MMAGLKYSLTKNTTDSFQSVPWAIIKFFSFVGKDTLYDTGAQVSINDLSSIIKVRETVVVSDILKLRVSSSKNGFMSTGDATLSSGDLNYLSLLSPGDHAMIWMGTDYGDFERISNRILGQNLPSNDFNSGLKFIGRVNSVRAIYNTATGGTKTLRYAVTFKGFSELGTSLYYNYALAPNSPENQGNSDLQQMTRIYGEISKSWNSYFFSNDKNKVNTQSLIQFLIDIFLGVGPGDEAQRIDKAVKSPNSAFLIPKELLSILGIPNKNPTPNYANMINLLMGIQNYTNNSFMPDINPTGSISVQKFTPKQLHGTVTTPPDVFNNTPLFSVLQQICNPVINEIYTTMRVNENNQIMPFFVARQIPFTSIYSKDDNGNPLTGGGAIFTDLPRWTVSDSIALGSFNIGTSDAARFNFFQIYGQLFGVNSTSPNFAQFAQIKAGNFALNPIDVMRNGSRNMVQTVLSDFSDTVDQKIIISDWAQLIKDWYGNSHLKLNGTLTTVGIQAPVAVGDNLELAGKLFHIESITHDYTVDDTNGPGPVTKSFVTSFDLSQGVLSDGSYAFNEPVARGNLNQNNRGLEPGFSDEERYVNDQPIIGVPSNSEKDKSNV